MFFIQRNPFGTTIEGTETSYPFLERVSHTEVTGSAVTSVDITGLDESTDGYYVLFVKWVNNAGATASIACYLNNDTTATNYYYQFISANGAAVSGNRANEPRMMQTTSGTECNAWGMIGSVNGYAKVLMYPSYSEGASIQLFNTCISKTAALSTPAYIDQITLTASAANGIGIGTVVDLFKVTNF